MPYTVHSVPTGGRLRWLLVHGVAAALALLLTVAASSQATASPRRRQGASI